MDLSLRGKSAVVTGASRGIGRAIVLRLADEGAGVAICARGEPALREAEAELRSRSVPVYAGVCDVGDAEALDGFLQAARTTLGGVDILVNNPSGFVFSDDQAAWESTLNVDLMAAVRATATVAPWMGRPAAARSSTSPRSPASRPLASPRPTAPPRRPSSVMPSRWPSPLRRRRSVSIRSHPAQSSLPAAFGSKRSTTTRTCTAPCSRLSLGDEWVRGGSRGRRGLPGIRACELGDGRLHRRRWWTAQGQSVS